MASAREGHHFYTQKAPREFLSCEGCGVKNRQALIQNKHAFFIFFPSLANKGARTTATVKRTAKSNGLRLEKQQQVGKCPSHSFLNYLDPPLVRQ